ncbi:thioesterase family protein [Alloalcanivorax mobilis]|uniref:thioesterase family protein n=1 Tax=Alloalcanivorax mobilis TaxID=2019569 RepID=UPI0013001390|nr:thioesterase family protein [Alloalcanivorax mobilis]
MTSALFIREGQLFLPTQAAGGPWSPEYLHGGSPAGLLAWQLEQATADTGLRLARLSVDLLRPVPAKPLQVEIEVVRSGRRLRLLAANLNADGVTVCRASALYLEQVPVDVPDFGRFPAETLPRGDHPAATLVEVAQRQRKTPPLTLPGLHSTAQVGLIDGVDGRGWGRVWMRLPVPVVAGEPCSSTVQAATLSDFGNGIAQLRVAENTGSINADISLYLHREPRGEWLGLDARSRMEGHGNGLVETTLYDETGPVGRVLQATLAMPVYAGE